MFRLTRTLSIMGLGASLGLVGCVSMPAGLQGDYAPAQAGLAAPPGTAVRWGGRLASVEPQPNQTCFEVVAAPLDAQGRPRTQGSTPPPALGRFYACTPGFVEPTSAPLGQSMTVVGRVEGTVARQLGRYRLQEPHVRIDRFWVWPPDTRTLWIDQGPDWGWGPGWGPGWGRPGWGGYGWYGPRRGWSPGFSGPDAVRIPDLKPIPPASQSIRPVGRPAPLNPDPHAPPAAPVR